jgi:coenzyme PQQ precursor peptide PqqA
MIEPCFGFEDLNPAGGLPAFFTVALSGHRPKRRVDPLDEGDSQKNLLMRHCFDRKSVGGLGRYCASHHLFNCSSLWKDSAGEVFVPYYLVGRAEFVRFHLRRAKMAWKAPKIVEVPVGMEINMYACAARK